MDAIPTLGEILVLLAYSMTSALLESLSVLGILLLVSLILPVRWMRDVFVTRGTIAAMLWLGSIMLYMYRFSLVGYSIPAIHHPLVFGGIGHHSPDHISIHAYSKGWSKPQPGFPTA